MSSPDLGLERSYQRLLGWFPAEYRATYADEMLGVLMAGAAPSQRRPRPAEVADLLIAATRARIGSARRDFTDPRWRHASLAAGTLLAMVMLGLQVRRIAMVAGWHWLSVYPAPGVVLEEWLRLGGWALVATLALIGRRRWAGYAAWLGALAEAALLVWVADGFRPPGGLDALWTLVLAVAIAALLTVPGSARRGAEILGGRLPLYLASAVLLSLGDAALRLILMNAYGWQGLRIPVAKYYPEAGWLAIGVCGLGAIGLVLAVRRIAPPILRRMLVLLAPVAVLLPLLHAEFPYVFGANFFRPTQLAVLICAPILVTAALAALQRRHEERLGLLALGRAAAARGEVLPAAGSDSTVADNHGT